MEKQIIKRYFTEEERRKISERMKNRIVSDETRKRMSESAKIRCDQKWRDEKSLRYSKKISNEQIVQMYQSGKTQDEIADYFNVGQKLIYKRLKKMGIKCRSTVKRDQIGEKNDYWKGGRILVCTQREPTRNIKRYGNGYYYVKNPSHPNANKSGYVAEHVMVATEKYKRPLKKGEMVHHVDLNKSNNDPNNLTLCDRRSHGNLHSQIEMVAMELMDKGLIQFNDEKGYHIVDNLKEVIAHACE